MTALSDESAAVSEPPCDSCDGHGCWVEGSNPGRIKVCPVCGGTRVQPEAPTDAS